MYCEQGLKPGRMRPTGNVAVLQRTEWIQASRVNEYWTRDFVADTLFNDSLIRNLTGLDTFSGKLPRSQ